MTIMQSIIPTSAYTSSRNEYVVSSLGMNDEKPTAVPVYNEDAVPSRVSAVYDASAAVQCEGPSISGTTRTKWAAAWVLMVLMSALV
jgi:hypothetical protein